MLCDNRIQRRFVAWRESLINYSQMLAQQTRHLADKLPFNVMPISSPAVPVGYGDCFASSHVANISFHLSHLYTRCSETNIVWVWHVEITVKLLEKEVRTCIIKTPYCRYWIYRFTCLMLITIILLERIAVCLISLNNESMTTVATPDTVQ